MRSCKSDVGSGPSISTPRLANASRHPTRGAETSIAPGIESPPTARSVGSERGTRSIRAAWVQRVRRTYRFVATTNDPTCLSSRFSPGHDLHRRKHLEVHPTDFDIGPTASGQCLG